MIPETLLDHTFLRFPRFDRGNIAVEPLEKGGSGRKYYRISMNGENSLILVKYTGQREENLHFCDIAQFLREVGVRVPEIYHHDPEEGLIWAEDLGQIDLWHFRNDPWPRRRALYRRTLEQAVLLHTRGHVALADGTLRTARPHFQQAFDAALYRWEQNYFFENCAGRHFGLDAQALDTRHEGAGREWLHEIAEQLAARPRVLVHRDFQSQNVMILGAEGQEHAAFIDFQGMRPGLAEYDLASLFYDPYVRISREERESLLDDYALLCAEAGYAVGADFRQIFDLCAIQRLMQALGAYGFLGHTQGKPHFLEHIPVALASLREVAGRIAESGDAGTRAGIRALCGLLDHLAAA